MKTYQIATDYESPIYVISDNIVDAHKKFRERFLAYVGSDNLNESQSNAAKLRKIHSITKCEYDIVQSSLKEGVNFDMTLYKVIYDPTLNHGHDLDIKLVALSNSQSLDKILKMDIIEVTEYTGDCIIIN